MDAGYIRVNSLAGDVARVIEVSGELTVTTDREFADRVAAALAMSPGRVLFDLSGLDFVDRSGARALARAVQAVPSGETGVYGCGPVVRRVLDALGIDLPFVAELNVKARARPRPRPRAREATLSRGETLVAMARAAQSSARQSALYGGEVMARLAATYSDLALSGTYRTPRKSEDRQRLLTLSGRARDLPRQYMRHAGGGAG